MLLLEQGGFENEKNDVMKVQEGESPNKRNVK